MAQFFCPACFAKVSETDAVCPVCSADIEAWREKRTFPERLIHALKHPMADVRMQAIIALGHQAIAEAAIPLAQCALDYPIDVVQGLEIIKSLDELAAGPEHDTALAMLARHPAHAVRQAAASLIESTADH